MWEKKLFLPITSISASAILLTVAFSTFFEVYSSHMAMSRGITYLLESSMIPTESPSSIGEWSVYRYSRKARKFSAVVS